MTTVQAAEIRREHRWWRPFPTSAARRLVVAACSVAAFTSCTHDGGWPRECPSPNRPGVNYIHETWEGRTTCAVSDYSCTDGDVYLGERFPRFDENDCGCGCFSPREARDAESERARTSRPAESPPGDELDGGDSADTAAGGW